MKKLYIVTFFLLLFPLIVYAQPANIQLKLPADGSAVTTYTQDFIYSFDQYVDILNCSLIVDDEVEKVRNTLFRINDNKITLELEAGKHDWFMKCYDIDFNEIVSETRTLSVNTGEEAEEGYETMYYSSGSRGYVFTIAPGQEAVELPVIKGGDDIQIKIAGKTYFLDIIKMGADINTSFVEIRDRSIGIKHRMLVPSTLGFDFDDDETVDVELSLTKVDRSVDAYFTVAPYPGSVVEEEEPVEEAIEEPEETDEPEVIEEEIEEEDLLLEPEPEEVEEATESEQDSELAAEPQEPEEEPEKKSKTWLIILIIAVILIIILVIILLVAKRRKKFKETTAPKEEKQQKSEIFESPSGRKQKKEIFESPSGRKQVKKEVKKEVKQKKEATQRKVKRKEVKEKKIKEEKPKQEPKQEEVQREESSKPDEEQPVFDGSFDIIKSTGRKMKK